MVGIAVRDLVHHPTDQMNTKTADGAIFDRQLGIDLVFLRRIEGFPCVADDKGDEIIVGLSLDIYIANRSLRIGIVHDVDNSLLDGQIQAHRDIIIDISLFAETIDKLVELRDGLNVVRQCQTIHRLIFLML